MVRVKDKKPKGDDAFSKKKQKVGRKKLAPATSTRAEVSARGLRVGVAKSIVDAQTKHANQSSTSNTAEEARVSAMRPKTAAGGAAAASAASTAPTREAPLPDILQILVSITHYKAGSRTHSLRNAVHWVRHNHGRTAQESPGVTVQLLQGALNAVTDQDGSTRDAAAAVVLAVDRFVLTPGTVWPAVAEAVADRVTIALTHAAFGSRATAVQLLSDMCGAAGSSDFFRFLCGAGVAAADGAVEAMLRNVIIVVKTKPALFAALPPILSAILSTTAGPEAAAFAARHVGLLVECLRDVWEFGCIRVKESFELGTNLLRNENAMDLTTGILRSTAILVAALASCVGTAVRAGAASGSNGFAATEALPARDFFSSIAHICTHRLPVSLGELCSLKTTSARKAQLATALGAVFQALVALHREAYTVPSVSQLTAEAARGVRGPLSEIVGYGFALVAAQQQQQDAMPALAVFAFEAAAASQHGDLAAVFTPQVVGTIPQWLDVALQMLRHAVSTGAASAANDFAGGADASNASNSVAALQQTITQQLFPVLRATAQLHRAEHGAAVHDAVAQAWSKLVQMLFMLRSLILAVPSGAAAMPPLLLVARHGIELLYEFLSTGRRTFFAPTQLAAAESTARSERWASMLTSVATVVAMKVPSAADGDADAENWILGSVLSAPCDAAAARIIDPETRSLCLGALHFAAACLRDGLRAAEMPASWKAIEAASARSSSKLCQALHALPSGAEYTRLLRLCF